MTTPLGRDIPLGEWTEYRKDQVLGLLYEFQRSPFNDGTLLFSLASICNATRLDLSDARTVAGALVSAGLAEEPVAHSFRVTQRGVQFINAVRANPLFGVA